MKGLINRFELCLFRTLHTINNLLVIRCTLHESPNFATGFYTRKTNIFNPLARDLLLVRKTGRFLSDSAIFGEYIYIYSNKMDFTSF